MLRATARVHISCDGRALGRILATAMPERVAGRGPRRRSVPSPGRRPGATRGWRGRSGGSARRLPALLAPLPSGTGRHPAVRAGGHAAPGSRRSTTASAGSHRTATTRSVVPGDRVPPGAVVQRHRQPARRLHRHRAGRRVHLGGEQLLLPAHAVAQRSGQRPGQRGGVPAGRRDRRALVRHPGPIRADDALHGAARRRAARPSSTSAVASPPTSPWAWRTTPPVKLGAAPGDQPG